MGNGAAVGDYDGDGDLDIYLLGHLGQTNRLYRNELEKGTPIFTDVTPDDSHCRPFRQLGRRFAILNRNIISFIAQCLPGGPGGSDARQDRREHRR